MEDDAGEAIEAIVNGVPRDESFGKWKYEHFEPEYPSRYAAVPPRKGGDAPEPAEPAPWRSIRVQVVAPNENSGDPGRVVEAEYAVAGGEVRLKYEDKLYAEAIKPGDDPVVIARRLLRAKWNSGGAFYDDIRYPPRGYH
jgi:hypothetical protein